MSCSRGFSTLSSMSSMSLDQSNSLPVLVRCCSPYSTASGHQFYLCVYDQSRVMRPSQVQLVLTQYSQDSESPSTTSLQYKGHRRRPCISRSTIGSCPQRRSYKLSFEREWLGKNRASTHYVCSKFMVYIMIQSLIPLYGSRCLLFVLFVIRAASYISRPSLTFHLLLLSLSLTISYYLSQGEEVAGSPGKRTINKPYS